MLYLLWHIYLVEEKNLIKIWIPRYNKNPSHVDKWAKGKKKKKKSNSNLKLQMKIWETKNAVKAVIWSLGT